MSDNDVCVQLHKELVGDIRKLMFSLESTPLAANTRRGGTTLAFVLLMVEEEIQLRVDQEAFDGDTSLTPERTRAAKRKCLHIPHNFDPFERLLRRYIKAGQWLFGVHCPLLGR